MTLVAEYTETELPAEVSRILDLYAGRETAAAAHEIANRERHATRTLEPAQHPADSSPRMGWHHCKVSLRA